MDYAKKIQAIDSWGGVKTDYWKAVNILKENKRLSEDDIRIVNFGLTRHSKRIVEKKMPELKAELEAKLPLAPKAPEAPKAPKKPKTPKKDK